MLFAAITDHFTSNFNPGCHEPVSLSGRDRLLSASPDLKFPRAKVQAASESATISILSPCYDWSAVWAVGCGDEVIGVEWTRCWLGDGAKNDDER